MTSDDRQPRFFLSRDNVELDAGFAIDPVNEFRSVRCAPASFGRDRPGKMDIAPHELVGADRKRGNGTVHCRIAQPATRPHTLAQPDDPRKGIDNEKLIAIGPRDQHPAIIGAKIERGIGMTRGKAGAVSSIGPGRRRARFAALPRQPLGNGFGHTRILFCSPHGTCRRYLEVTLM